MANSTTNEKIKSYEKFISEKLKPDLLLIQEKLDALDFEISEYEAFKSQLKHVEDTFTSLVDIGCNTYVQGQVEDTKEVIVSIGMGFFVQVKRDEANQIADKRQIILQKRREKLVEEKSSVQSQIKLVILAVQEKKRKGPSQLKALKEKFKASGLTNPLSLSSHKISKNASAAKRRGLVDVRSKSKQKLRSSLAAENPFDLKSTNLKHAVFNDNKKGVVGRPGVTHKKGEIQRKKTLLVEMKKINKESSFTDRRFGESNPNLSREDKQLERFVREKTKRANKKSIYNLEEEELTHMGQSLDTAPDYVPADEDDDDNALSSDFVSQMHFGGGGASASKDFIPDTQIHKSRSEIMSEIIQKSKFHKSERQKLALENSEISRQVDEDYEFIKSLVPKKVKEEVELDDFDLKVKELALDRKGTVTDRIKSEEEIALMEKMKLEKLESDRLRRMKGVSEIKEKRAPQGDDLDDTVYAYGDDGDEDVEEMPLTYKDGVLVNQNVFLSSNIKEGKRKQMERNGDDGMEDSDDEDEDDDEMEDEEDEEFDEDASVGSGVEVEFEDVKEFESEEEGSEDESENEAQMDDGKELPYTYPAPATYKDLLDFFHDKSPLEKSTILERIRILYHIKTNPQNAEILKTLSKILLEHINYVTSNSSTYTEKIEEITVVRAHLVPLLRQFPDWFAEHMTDQNSEMMLRLLENISAKKTEQLYPSVYELMLLKITGDVFSTSDYQHPIITPVLLLVSQHLTSAPINSFRDLCAGLFMCNLVYSFVEESKRLVPEVVDFLRFAVDLLSGEAKQDRRFVKPLTADTEKKNKKKKAAEEAEIKVGEMLFQNSGFSQLVVLESTKKLVLQFANLYSDSVAFYDLFLPFSKNFEIPQLGDAKTRPHLQLQTRKPIPISSHTPRISSKFSLSRSAYSKNKQTQQSLQSSRDAANRLEKMYKREMKGAVRELRKDAGFISRVKMREKRAKDEAYKKKMGKLVGSLAQQEGEFKGMDKKKGKKRR